MQQRLGQFEEVSSGHQPRRALLAPQGAVTAAASAPFVHDARDARELFERLLPSLHQLPAGQMGISRPHTGLRIAIISDTFLFESFAGLAELIPLTPRNWEEPLEQEQLPDILLVAATWRGLNERSWRGLSNPASNRRRLTVEEIMPAYRRRGIPVVYYGKEDPPNYSSFVGLAQAADHIFTTAAEMIPDYRRDCPQAASVDVLPFAVNPLVHTPLGSRPAVSPMIHFAGSWLPDKYPQRSRYGTWALNGAALSDRPLVIFDRNSDLFLGDPRYSFPTGYSPYLAPAREREDLMLLQRGTDIAVNLNSVVASQTMFANRVLELQATGTMVISSYNQGVNSYYPQVHIANSTADVSGMLEALTTEELRRIQGDGIRKVFSDDHGVNRLAAICRVAGVPEPQDHDVVLAVAEHPTPQLVRDLRHQTHSAVDVVSWEQLPQRHGTYDILLPVSASRRYSPTYVADHAASFAYSAAAASHKLDGDAEAADPLAHRHHQGASALPDLSLSSWWRPEAEQVSSPQALRRHAEQAEIYAIDHLGHRAAAESVTLQPQQETPAETGGTEAPLYTGDDVGAKAAEFRALVEELDLTLAVVVPVYNNADHLRHKAFQSLRRSRNFHRMHILLVNDGSTDMHTVDTVDELAASWPNVSAFHHSPGGSGSASRPRNTGLDLSFTEFVTYLDPDDEEYRDGYSVLMEALEARPDAEFAVGDMIRWRSGRKHMHYVNHMNRHIEERDGLLRPAQDSLRQMRFVPVSIEAVVARTDWLKSLGLTQPVGATGQDTYFFQQMLYYSTAILTISKAVYTYYGAVDTSIVNVVSPRYFRKYLILEEHRTRWLEETGLMQDYRDTRLEPFFRSWYLNKLEKVPADQRQEADDVVRELAALYGDHQWQDPAIRCFLQLEEVAR
ncbi:glycosyltransferase [Nesterenkonia sp. HG001]|uniref:glycosyltransferase n=1 Tax=Nesterenkonia sp. HG001 TaxID=2983207 RepID=UPI002AC5ED6D|nr:glycosyltransferase [Nesterenkonia sp. HG001]MDZ5076988.1 glycosyltransferase [Nesterenkonia sp. HG001]